MNMAMKNSGLGERARALFLICLCGAGLMFSTVAYGATTVTITTDVSNAAGGRNANADGDGTAASSWTGTAAVDDANLVINGGATVALGEYAMENPLVGGFTKGNGVLVSNSSVTIGVDGGGDSTALFWKKEGNAAYSFIAGGLSMEGSATGNSVAVYQKIKSSNASVTISLYGSQALLDSASETVTDVEASYNTVLVLAGAVLSNDAAANYHEIYGGVASIDSGSANATSSGNTVTIGNGVSANHVYGGAVASVSGRATANDNTVNLLKNAGDIGNLGGGIVMTGSGAMESLNNTLNVVGYKGTVGTAMAYFQNYNFFLDEDTDAESPILSVPTLGVFQDTTINVGFIGETTLTVGDRIYLVDVTTAAMDLTNNTSLSASDLNGGSWINATANGEGLDGILAAIPTMEAASLVYDAEFSLAFEDTDTDENSVRLVATLDNMGQSERGESVTSGAVATLGTQVRAGDLVARGGMLNLLGVFHTFDQYQASAASTTGYASLGNASGWSGPVAFAAVEGGSYTFSSKYDVDVDGISYLAGLGWRNVGACGALVVGAFFEGGYSDFDSHDLFGGTRIKSDGNNQYYGGGLMARYDWANGFYAEGSFRAGQTKTKYNSDYATGVNYKLSTLYLGAHAGVGYKLPLSGCSVLDLSAKYLWAHQGDDSVTALGTRFDFDKANSHRLAAGARYSYNAPNGFSPYVGASFEYELDGKTRANAVGFEYGRSTMKGGTGVGEIGFTYRSRNSGFMADLGVQGHVGKRQGVSGSLKVGWAF